MKERKRLVFVEIDEDAAREVHAALLKLIQEDVGLIVVGKDIGLVPVLKLAGAIKKAIEA